MVGMYFEGVSGQLPAKTMILATVTAEGLTSPAQQTMCIRITHLLMMGMITAKCSLSTVVVFCLCALRDGEHISLLGHFLE